MNMLLNSALCDHHAAARLGVDPAPLAAPPSGIRPLATVLSRCWVCRRNLTPTAANDTDATRLAWAAGFVDGEGSIYASCYQQRDRPHPTITIWLNVSQNRRDVLEELLEIVGVPGKIYPLRRQKNHSRQCWTCVWAGPRAVAAMRRLRPYLRRKDREADRCFQYVAQCAMSKHSGPCGHSAELWALRQRLPADLNALK